MSEHSTEASSVTELSLMYSNFNTVVETVSRVLNSEIPADLQPLVFEIRKSERMLRDMLSTEAHSELSIDITEEGAIDFASSMYDSGDPAMVALHSKQCKVAARRLYRTKHPDFGGDSLEFDLLRKAEKNLDLEYLHMCLYREGLHSDYSLGTLKERLNARISKFHGSQASKVACLKMSGSPDFQPRLKTMLESRLRILNFKIATWAPTKNENS
jgi:hypothetical protein